jgi:hypothetical protein
MSEHERRGPAVTSEGLSKHYISGRATVEADRGVDLEFDARRELGLPPPTGRSD